MRTSASIQQESVHQIDKATYLALYSAAADQNKLYAEFRWRVLSFLTTLEAALLYATVQTMDRQYRVVYCAIGIMITFFLLALEERHHKLFAQSRKVASDIENILGVADTGVFNTQFKKKGKGHNFIVRLWCITLIILWCVFLILFATSAL